MADENVNHPHVRTYSASELQALADRLTARSMSDLFPGGPETKRDMLVGARVIRVLLNRLDAAADRCADTANALRNLALTVDVENRIGGRDDSASAIRPR